MRKILSLMLAAMMVFALAACTAPAPEATPAPTPEAEGKFTAGTYTGSATGFGGLLTAEVTLSENRIESVAITEDSETAGIGSKAIEALPGRIVATQSVAVDGVSGATYTSGAIIEAVTAALAEAGVDASALVPVPEAEGEADEAVLDCDVVVIGAGGAGLAAAITAHDAGKSVVIVEKTAMAGGNSVRSTGGMNAAATPEQAALAFAEGPGVEKTLEAAKGYPALAELAATVQTQYDDFVAGGSAGYFDSVELFVLDTLIGGKNVNDYDLVYTLAANSASGVEWLHTIGADLVSVASFGGASVKRIHRPLNEEGKVVSVGAYLIPIMEKACADRGIEILFESPATRIIMKDGKAAGVAAGAYTINAKAVVLATGGFGANLEMVVSYQPGLAGFVTTNAPGITGDGIVMAEAVGAATVDMDQIQIHPTVEQNTSALITEGLRGDGAILVNAEGRRFTDEVGTRDVVSAAEIAQTGSFAYLVIDQKMADDSNVIQGYIKQGFTVSGSTYEELAAAMGVDGTALAATMDAWNASVAAGADAEFGRTSFARALDAAPFYAIKVAPGVHHTMGGVRIDTSARVIGTSGSVIPGLFACGEVTGGIHGANRLGGNAVADFVVFGRIAGASAADYAK